MKNRRNRGTFIDQAMEDAETNAIFNDIADEFEPPPPVDLKVRLEGKNKKAAREKDDDDETMAALEQLSISDSGGNLSAEASIEKLRKGQNGVAAPKMKYDLNQPAKKVEKKVKLMQGAKGSYQSNDDLKYDMQSAQVCTFSLSFSLSIYIYICVYMCIFLSL